jgi:hypothetical protein
MPIAAQAADLPIKARAVEYVRVCDAFGAGFWYVPGTQSCMKIGMYLRNQLEWEASGAQIYRNGSRGRFTRAESPGLSHRVRGWVSVDTRTKTDYGTLRAYMNIGAQQTTPSVPDEEVYMNRAFIQVGGLTVGRATSFYDMWSFSRYNYVNNLTQANMGASGQMVLGYTFRFSDGLSATLAIEDGQANAAGANGVGTARGKWTVDLSSGAPLTLGGVTVDNGSYAMPDIVANVRLDQSWGSAQISGALHQNRGGYYSGIPVATCGGATANTTNCGHPADEIGYALAAGLVFNDIFGLRGDSISLHASYGHGAVGYTTRGTGAWRIWGSGASTGLGWALDSVFANGTNLELIDSYQAQAAYEHRWNRQWRTSLWGGYVGIDYSSGATALICATPAAPLGTTLTAVSNCQPDYSFWNIGTRTQWNPHPYLSIGLDLQYFHLNTAFAGTAVVPADGARPGGAVTVEDQDHYGAFFRIQYSMLP